MGFFTAKKLSEEEEAKRRELIEKRKAARASGVFVSKSSVFSYLFYEEGLETEEAQKLAEIWAQNLNLPDVVHVKKSGIAGFVDNFKEISVVIKENPEAVEVIKPLITGAVTALVSGLAGAFAANKSHDSNIQEVDTSPINPIEI